MDNQNWHPDTVFIDFLREDIFVEMTKRGINMSEPIITSGEQSWSMDNLFQEMIEGTKKGQNLYNELVNNPTNQKRFADWKNRNLP